MDSSATAPTLTEDGVAAALQIPVMSFRKRRKRLEASGFPHRLPDLPQRWSTRQVHAWINGETTKILGLDQPQLVSVIAADPAAEDRAYLERAYGGRS